MSIQTLFLPTIRHLFALSPARPGRAVFRAMDLSRQRHALKELETHRLLDLGLDPEAAAREAARWTWGGPDRWRN
ncbi:hypothetical protein [Frigidibacter sp. SD6-1]|uniref:hypothetical protein n=1 Tax=Frigidibacter sp. SD6-1 TaxID=3032581 RepID=UPI0024E02413|nr:hypothetical protein [Frigidibacter sp. SD6-1]